MIGAKVSRKLIIKYAFLTIMISFNNCKIGDMNESSFCTDISNNDEIKVKQHTNAFLSTLDIEVSEAENFTHIKNWLESFDCIKNVELLNRIIQTRPPIVQFRFSVNDDTLSESNYLLKVTFNSDFEFYQLLIETQL